MAGRCPREAFGQARGRRRTPLGQLPAQFSGLSPGAARPVGANAVLHRVRAPGAPAGPGPWPSRGAAPSAEASPSAPDAADGRGPGMSAASRLRSCATWWRLRARVPPTRRAPRGRTAGPAAAAVTRSGDRLGNDAAARAPRPDQDVVTTAPVWGSQRLRSRSRPRRARRAPGRSRAGGRRRRRPRRRPRACRVRRRPRRAGRRPLLLVGSQAVLWHRQRRLAGALHRSQSSFRTLVKSSVDPVVILDDAPPRHLRLPGRRRPPRPRPAGALGLPLVDAVHPDDRASLSARSTARRAARRLAVRTARVRHADGRWRLIQATVRDLRTDPDVGALVLYCRDVTSRVPRPASTPNCPSSPSPTRSPACPTGPRWSAGSAPSSG